MRDGFIKVSAVTPDVRVADVDYNTSVIIDAMKAEYKKHTKICVFPCLSVTGCTCGDLFNQQILISRAQDALVRIAEASKGHDMLTFVGLPWRERDELNEGIAVVQDGEILTVITERNYDTVLQCVNMDGLSISVGTKIGDATVVVMPSAISEAVEQDEHTDRSLRADSGREHTAVILANAGPGESTMDEVYAGHNIIAEDGEILVSSPAFFTGAVTTEIDTDRLVRARVRDGYESDEDICETVNFGLKDEVTGLTRKYDGLVFVPKGEGAEDRLELILNIQAHGLMKRMSHVGGRNVVLGISGGLDSTCALIVCAKAFDALGIPRKNIHAITMPCFGTSDRTYNNACALIKRMGCRFSEINIKDAVTQHLKDIGHKLSDHNVAFENAQARERTQVLMDIANDENAMVVGTGDLSELALGWATYNGDHMSNYSVNADVPKTLMRHLVRHYAETCGDKKLHDILIDVIDTPVSPELLPPVKGKIAQKTEDLVGPYELHDFFLYYAVRFGFEPAKIYRLACEAWGDTYGADTVLRWIKVFYKRFFSQQFKRSCMPDGPKVGTVDLSPRGQFSMPTDACVKIWLDQLEEIRPKTKKNDYFRI